MNEEKIWKFLKAQGLSDAGAAGLMGNLYAESGLSPINLQNSYEKKLGFTDQTYTSAVDSGRYVNFVRDKAGYGLCQWTYWSRKEALLNYAKAAKKSIGDLDMQLGFMMKELTGYPSLMSVLKSTRNIKEASDAVLTQFERPADQGTAMKNKRASYGQTYFDRYAKAASTVSDGSALIEKLLKLAAAEIGVTEVPANSDNVKYNTEYYGRAVKSTATTKYYWCVAFQWWLFRQAGLSSLFYGGGKTASCGELKEYAKKHGQWVTSGYRRGDLPMFNFKGGSNPTHIGLCESFDGKTIVTIDGNTSAGESGSQDNGGMVNRRSRDKKYIVGAFRPNYAGGLTVLRRGMVHPDVKILQAYLNDSGFSCGEVDGSFGPKTDAAFRAWQKANGLTVDGICGPISWSTILGA